MVNGLYPKTIKEALENRKQFPGAVVVGGGSDIMVTKKTSKEMIFVNQISEIRKIEITEKNIQIGAGVTYVELIRNPLVPDLIKKVVKTIASPAIRNVGTMVGNICNASPAGDSLPLLYALDAKVVKGKLDEDGNLKLVVVPIEEFILGIRKIALADDELVLAVEIEKQNFISMTKQEYQKVGAREAEAISKLSFIGCYQLENNRIKDIRVAFGAVGITVVRRKELEQRIIGLTLEELACKRSEILSWYEDILKPIDDQRSSAKYRKKVCINLLQNFLS